MGSIIGILVRAARGFKSGSSDFGRPSGFHNTSHGWRESVGFQAEGSPRSWKEDPGLIQQKVVDDRGLAKAKEVLVRSKEEVPRPRREPPGLMGFGGRRIEGAKTN